MWCRPSASCKRSTESACCRICLLKSLKSVFRRWPKFQTRSGRSPAEGEQDHAGAWSIFQKSWSRTSRTNSKMHLILDFALLCVSFGTRAVLSLLKGFSGGQRSAAVMTLILYSPDRGQPGRLACKPRWRVVSIRGKGIKLVLDASLQTLCQSAG